MHKLGGESFEIEVFFDGGCPLCAREMNSLRHRDKSHGIKITDIHDRGFDPGDHGKSLGELMAQMHGRLPDGTWLRGVEVFRRLYHAIAADLPNDGRQLLGLREKSTAADGTLCRW